MSTQCLRKLTFTYLLGLSVLLIAAGAVVAEEAESCELDGVKVGFQGTVCGIGPFFVTLNGVSATGENTKCLSVAGGNFTFTSTNKAWVKLKLDQTYVVTSGTGICVNHINFDVPKGYILYIDGIESTTIYKTDGGVSPSGDGSWNVVLRKECPSCGKRGTLDTGNKVGSVIWESGLGKLTNGRPAEQISVREKTLSSSIYTPAALVYSPPAKTTEIDVVKSGALLRQIKAPQVFADIVVISSSEYDIRYYRPADVGAKSGGIYTVTGQPFVTWKFKNPDPTTLTKLEIQKFENGAASPSDKSEYIWDPFIDSWTLSTGWSPATGNYSRVETVLVTYPTATARTETFIVKEGGNGPVVSLTVKTYQTFPWGEELVQEVQDPDQAALTTTYTYYQNPSEDYRYQKLSSVRFPDGSWEKYDYDVFFNISTIMRPWKDLAMEAATPENSHFTRYRYTNSDNGVFGLSAFPKIVWDVEEKINGVIVTKTHFTRSIANVDPDMITISNSSYSGSNNGDPVGLIGETVTTNYRFSAPDFLANRVAAVLNADGTKDTYTYEQGNYVPNANPALSVFVPDVNGLAERQTIVHGTTAAPAGIAFKTTKETIVRDQLGNEVLQETYIYNGTDYERFGWTVNDYNSRGQLTMTRNEKGEITTVVWTGDLKNSEIDAEGKETLYEYDSLNRLKKQTRKGIAAGGGVAAQADIVTNWAYDAEGRRTSQTIEGTPLATLWFYDIAGRLKREKDQANLDTFYSYSNGGRTQTMQRPGGATTVMDNYLDRRAKSVTGTAVVASYFDYGVNPDGTRFTQEFVGSAGLSSPRWTKTSNDWMGRTIAVETPSFTGGNSIKTLVYNALGQLQKETTSANSVKLIADTLHEYDELGQQIRMGLDVDNSGTLTLSSTDRLTETFSVYEKTNSDWFIVTSSKSYLTDNNETAVSQTQRERLNNFAVNGTANVISEVTVTDVSGHDTTQTIAVDRSAKKQTTTIDTPDSNVNSVSISVNGLLQSSSASTPQAATLYTYDTLGRQISVTPPSTGATSRTYDGATGQLASVTQGAGTTIYEYYGPTHVNAGRLKSQTNAAGKKTYFNYSARGEVIQTWGDATYPVEYVYDGYGQRTEFHTFRGGQNWSATIWPAASTGTPDVTKWIFHEATGLLTQKQDAVQKGTVYTYDELRRMKTRVWARGITCTYSYDPNTGEMIGVSYSDSTPAVTLAYDRGGRVISVVDATGSHTRTFNVAGELQTDQVQGGILDGVGLSVGYDTFLRRTLLQSSRGGNSLSSQTLGFDPASRVQTITSGGQTVTYAYHPTSGLLNTTTFQDGTNISRGYDGFGRLQNITTTPAFAAAQSYTYTYNNLDQRTRLSREDGSYWIYTYNDRGELQTGKKYWADNSIVWGAQTEYSFDNIGNRKYARNGGNQLGSLRQSDYVANSLNQYAQRAVPGMVDVTGTANTNATVTVNNYPTARKGDYFYNETAVNNDSAPAYPLINVNGARNNFGAGGEDAVKETGGRVFVPKAVEAFTYDDDGNLSTDGRWTYTWDGENRLISVQALATVPVEAKQRLEFAYDHQSRRVQKKAYVWNVSTSSYELQSTTKFIYDGWRLVAELDGSGNLLRSNVWGIQLLSINAGARIFNVGHDGNENVGLLVEAGLGTVSAVYEYDPFGQTLKAVGDYANQNPFRYSSQYTDVETGLVYYGYRYYAPQFGRWINRDPIGERGGINLYGMLNNDSVGAVDALGLARESQIDDAKNPLTYSCNCGWIDWGHARPDGAKRLLDRITTPWGQLSLLGGGHHVIYGQQAGIDILGQPIRKGVVADYFVKENRLHAEYEAIALGIFKEVSEAFERSQGDLFQDKIMHSSFSEEDLVSNLIGFYRGVKNYSVPDIDTWCKVIRNKEVNHKIWQNGGAPSMKNLSWMPVFHQEAAKKNGCCPDMPWFPQQFRAITPMPKGFLWRDWLRGIDDALPPGVRPYRTENPRESLTVPFLDF